MSGSRRSPLPRPPGTLLLLVALGMAAQCLSVPTLAQAPGIAADARDFAALESADWLQRLVETGFQLAQPAGVFPRLELPADAD